MRLTPIGLAPQTVDWDEVRHLDLLTLWSAYGRECGNGLPLADWLNRNDPNIATWAGEWYRTYVLDHNCAHLYPNLG